MMINATSAEPFETHAAPSGIASSPRAQARYEPELVRALMACGASCGREAAALASTSDARATLNLCRDTAILCRFTADLLRRSSPIGPWVLPVTELVCRATSEACESSGSPALEACAQRCMAVSDALDRIPAPRHFLGVLEDDLDARPPASDPCGSEADEPADGEPTLRSAGL